MAHEKDSAPNSPLDSELDQYDLLGAEDGNDPLVPRPDLTATAQAFNTRIQRKKREQEKVLGEAEKQTRQRQMRLLTALMKIRKSLRDVTRIDLGDRFHLMLRADDWQGWPRLAIQLKDSVFPRQEFPSLRVVAHDRQSRGMIEIEYDPAQAPESISVATEAELKRLAPQLKRCVRAFLDLTGDIVLNAERQANFASETKDIENKTIPGLEPVEAAAAPQILADLMDEDDVIEDFLERLPTLEHVDSLPGLGSPTSSNSKNSK